MAKLILSVLFVLIYTIKSFGCDCKYRSLKNELETSNEVIAGQLLGVNKDFFTIKVLKTWKGNFKDDILLIPFRNGGCYGKFLYPEDQYFLIYLEDSGIHLCSRTITYTKSQDIQLLDSVYSQTLWINKRTMLTLAKLEYARKYVIVTNKGEIDIKGKNVVFNFEGKVIDRAQLPADLNDFYPVRYYLVATGDSISNNPCGIDYIIYVNQVHQDIIELGRKRNKHIERKSVRLSCRKP